MNWFKTRPGIVHKIKLLAGVRLNKYDCVAYCGRRQLSADLYDEKPENEQICFICLNLLKSNNDNIS